MKCLSQRGAGQTEYILIVVLIAITTLFAVGRYGREVRSLFSKSKVKLDFKDLTDSNVNGDANGGTITPPSDDDSTDVSSDDNDSSSDSDDNDADEQSNREEECQNRYRDLMNEKNQIVNNYIQNYNELMREYNQANRVYQHYLREQSMYGSAWGYWNTYLDKIQMYRALNKLQRIRAQINALRQNYYRQLRDWQARMNQWRSECGHN